jgi:hypothetical protein
MTIKQFRKHVAETSKRKTMNERESTIAFRTLGMVSAVGCMHRYAEQEGKRFPTALRDFEYQYTALCQCLEYEPPVIEPEDNPTYTLPQLTDNVFMLTDKLFNQMKGCKNSLKTTLDDIEKALVNLYVVYNRALSFNGGEGITRDRLVSPN